MPSIQTVGGKSVVTAQLEMDINPAEEGAAARVHANWDELQAAFAMAGRADGEFDGNNGTVLLPAGAIFATGPDETGLGNIMLDERHAGITIQGAGRAKTLIVDPYRSVPQIQINSRRVSKVYQSPNYPEKFGSDTTTVTVPLSDIAQFAVGEVLYFWVYSLNRNDQSPSQRCRITAVNPSTGVVTFTPGLSGGDWNVFRHMKGHKASGAALAIGAVSVALPDGTFLGEFRVNDDIFITGGPAINETYGEWVTITGFHATLPILYFSPPLRQAYVAESVSLLPAPHMTDITLRDLAIAAPKNSEIRYMGSVTVGRRIRFDNVEFVPDGDDFVAVSNGPLDVATCRDISFQHCSVFGLSFSATHDGTLDDITARGFGFQEFCFDFECSRITIAGGNFLCQDTAGFGPCQRIHLRDCLALSYCINSGDPGFSIVEGSRISNVRLTNKQSDAPIYFNDDDIVLQNVFFDKTIYVFSRRMLVNNVIAPLFQVLPADGTHPESSSGVLLASFFDTSEMSETKLVDAATNGKWLRPLLVAKDGSATPPQVLDDPDGDLLTPGLKLPSPDAAVVPLTVQGAVDQEANLQEWKNSSGAVSLAVLPDGNIGTSKSASASMLGTVVKKLAIKDASGTLLGYLAIYDSIT